MLDMYEAGKWLKRAESALKKAQLGQTIQNVMWEDFCFDLQQTAEKCLKAMLAAKHKEIPGTQSIEELIPGVKKAGYRLPVSEEELAALDKYASELRIPHEAPEVTKKVYTAELERVTKLFQFVKKHLA